MTHKGWYAIKQKKKFTQVYGITYYYMIRIIVKQIYLTHTIDPNSF